MRWVVTSRNYPHGELFVMSRASWIHVDDLEVNLSGAKVFQTRYDVDSAIKSYNGTMQDVRPVTYDEFLAILIMLR